ncbi:DegT/DnrJ/EryC1/StrS family aminotransferase [Kiloniella laminariae]|uniref:DegT/DnrJ/EryC1/StrS family aminotransferase n=1 Tax=Kiloniella laminariae TaxID=454162 RepID=A0ABT4LMM2_9PROT|nr:DegT/DnrJ/EryC1/StrS family aminotransferase [Kiloniella laminariae]MCZ4282356.1 DegT/DnrJ/EryC1/StrS family aminotransferase [Kiloniella laminariae]
MKSIPFINLDAQRLNLNGAIEAAIQKVIHHGQFIMGPEVREFEIALEKYTGAHYAISCANGTDALSLALMAMDIQPNDIIFVPAFTFAASAEAVALLGAVPYFVDVDEKSFLLDQTSLKRSILDAKTRGFRPRGIIAVDLFGSVPDYETIQTIAKENNLFVIADAAQSIGGARGSKQVGTMADITTTSFFPSKPLGAYGDGGAVLTDNAEIAESIKSLRIHGKGKNKYDNIRIGMNSRLDTLQASILIEKIQILSVEILARQKIADYYSTRLPLALTRQAIPTCVRSAWAQYTLCCKNRNRIRDHLDQKGIPTAVYYPTPLNKLQAYKHFPMDSAGLSTSEKLSSQVFSLPMHPYLAEADQNNICAAIEETFPYQ